jgi:GLPGLI family protein
MNGNKVKYMLFLFLTITCYAQEYRVMYDYSFANDSTKIDYIQNEIMILDIDKKGSVFYSYSKYKFDSIAIEKNKRKENILEADKSKVLYYIKKEYPNYAMTFHTTLGHTNYAVKDNSTIIWKLENEKKSIKGIEAYKAIGKFGDRVWIAWYTKDIQLIDGPHKFTGLPGLILEVADTKKQHSFQFIGIEKNENGYDNFLMTRKLKEKVVTNKEFNKEWNEFKKDPAKDLKFTLLNSKLGFSINYDGKEYSVSEMIRNAEEQEKARFKRNNNFLELSLYK